MRSAQKIVVSPQFFSELEAENGRSGLGIDAIRKRKNYYQFLDSLLNTDVRIKFNCPNEEFQKVWHSSEFVGFLMQKVSETNDRRVLVTKNGSAMSFLQDDVPPTEQQLNDLYLKTCSKNERERALRFGVMALSPNDILNENYLYVNSGKFFEKGKRVEWSIGLESVCNSLIIADRYLLSSEKSKNLYPILEALIPKEEVQGFTLYMFAVKDNSDGRDEGSFFRTQWSEISKWLRANRKYPVELVLYSCKKEDFHDRTIFTNYVFGKSGAGFGVNTETDLTRNNKDGMYVSSRNGIKEDKSYQSTDYSIYFPLFSNGSLSMEQYVGYLKDLKNVVDAGRRLRVDRRYMERNPAAPAMENRLFSIIPPDEH